MRRFPLRLAVLAACTLTLPLGAQAKPDSVRFAPEAPLVVRTSELPRDVVLRNHSLTDTLRVTLRFHPLDGRPSPVRLVDSSLSIPKAGTAVARLQRGDTSPEGWPRRGYIAAYTATELDTLNVTVYRDGRMVSALPVTSWTIEVRRWTLLPGRQKCISGRGLLGTCVRGNRVPVSLGATADGGPAQGSVLGFVANDTMGRGTGTVVAAGRDTLPGGAVAEQLSLVGLGGVGTYKGSAKIGDTTLADLKVLVTHGLFFAVLPIALGILLATLMQRYATRDRLALLVRARILALPRDAAARNDEFRAAVGSRPAGGAYDILASARTHGDALLARLETITRQNATLTDEIAKPVTDKLDLLETALPVWPSVGHALAGLHDAIEGLQRRPRPWPHPDGADGASNAIPRILLDRAKVLVGYPMALDVAALEAERTKLQERTDYVLRWHGLIDDASRMVPRAETVVKDNPDSDAAKTALRDVREVWRTLWEEDVFNVAPLKQKLDGAEAVIRGLEPTMAADAQVGVASDEGTVIVRTEQPERARQVPPDPAALLARVRWLDRVFSILATLVALLVALGQVYYDEPVFGTPYDYLSAFLWAFSVKAGLEVLKSVGERIFTGLPIPRP